MSKPFINTTYDGHKHLRVPNTNTYNSFCARCGHLLSEFPSSEIEELNLTMQEIRAMNGWEEPDLRGAVDKMIAQNDGSNVFTSDSPFSKKEEPWQYGQEYEPSGEPDIISEDDQKLLDWLNNVEKQEKAGETDIFTWISQSLGLKPRKQKTYGPMEIEDKTPRKQYPLCKPGQIYDPDSHKCIPKYMAPWRIKNWRHESYAKEESNPKMGNLQRIEEIYNDLSRQIDPQDTGDVSQYYSDVIDDVAKKYNLSEYQVQEIWDSGGTTDIDISNEFYSSENENEDEEYEYAMDQVCTKCGLEEYEHNNNKLGHDFAMRGNEEIIEQKPYKPVYHYYKQYPLGRRANVKSHFGKEVSIKTLREAENWWKQVRVKQGYPEWNHMNIINKQRAITDYLFHAKESYVANEYNKEWWESASTDDKEKALKEVGFGLSARKEGEINSLALRSWEDLPIETRGQWGESYAKENDDIKGGDIVAYKDPFANGVDETSARMVVLEDNGDRVLIRPLGRKWDEMTFVPTEMISKDQLVNAMESYSKESSRGERAADDFLNLNGLDYYDLGDKDHFNNALKHIKQYFPNIPEDEAIDSIKERAKGRLVTKRESYSSITKMLNEAADFNEEEHPREDDGQFADKGGGSSGGKKEPSKKEPSKAQKDHTQAMSNYDDEMKRYDEKTKKYKEDMNKYKEKVKLGSQAKKKFTKTDEYYIDGIQNARDINDIVKYMNDRKHGFASKKVTYNDVSKAIDKFEKMGLVGHDKDRNQYGVMKYNYFATQGYMDMKHGPTQPKEPDKPTKPVKRKEEISQTKQDQLSRLADRYARAERGSKKSEYESQLHTKLDALNKSRDFVKDGHYIIDTDYNREKKKDIGVVRLMQPYKQDLTYPRAPTHDGYSSDYKPSDFEVGGTKVKVGDTIEFEDRTYGTSRVLVSGFNYGGDEWEGPSIDGYVTSSSNTTEHPKYQQKGHGDHRVSDVRRIVSSSNTKMKEGTRESYSSIIGILNEAEFKEEDHPRDKGKFTSKGGGSSGTSDKAKNFFDSTKDKHSLLIDAGWDDDSAYDASFKKFDDLDKQDQQEIIDHVKSEDEKKGKTQKREQTQDKLYKLEPKGDTLSDRHLEDRLNLLTDSQKDDIFEQIKGDHDMSDHGGPSTNASMSELRDYFRMDQEEWSNTLLKYSTMYDNEPIPDPYDLDSMDKAKDRINKETDRLKTVTSNAEKEYKVTQKLANKLAKSKSEFERNHGEKITKDAYWTHKHWTDKLDEITKIANNHKELSKKALTKSYSKEAEDDTCATCSRERDNHWKDSTGVLIDHDFKSKAKEGGRGSGKRGHAGWMKSLEEAGDYTECPNCKVMTEQYGGKCQLCGKKV